MLAKINSKLIGWYCFSRLLSSFLCTGNISATFQISEIFSFLSNCWKISFEVIVITLLWIWVILIDKLAFPWALVVSNGFVIDSISFSEMLKNFYANRMARCLHFYRSTYWCKKVIKNVWFFIKIRNKFLIN